MEPDMDAVGGSCIDAATRENNGRSVLHALLGTGKIAYSRSIFSRSIEASLGRPFFCKSKMNSLGVKGGRV